MGQIGSLCQQCGDGCFGLLFPKKAPDWYMKSVEGLGTGDIHLTPAPEGSLMLLGHISLGVPDLEAVRLYYTEGLKMGISLKCRPETGELRVNAGPSQLRFALSEGQEPQRWPGEIKVWVEDIRSTADMFNMMGRLLGADLVHELGKSSSGGEYALRLKCPFRKNWVSVSEAPHAWVSRLRQIGSDPSSCETEYPPKQTNALAIVDAVVYVHRLAVVEAAGRFYEHFLMGKVTMFKDGCYVHFAPGDCLHQTLTFREEPSAPALVNLGTVCIYLRTKQKFHLVFVRCQKAGILQPPDSDWEEVQLACEFRVRCCFDPETKQDVIPMAHVIRFDGHWDCPVR